MTNDEFQDLVIAAISSVVPEKLSDNEIIVTPSPNNYLRVKSVIKVDRLVTIKRDRIIAQLGDLEEDQLEILRTTFKSLIDKELDED